MLFLRILLVLVVCAAPVLSGGTAAAQDAETEPSAAATEGEAPDGEAAEADPSQAPAVPAEPLPPIYEPQLLRLAEILGALSFLRDICGETDGGAWRDEMAALLAAERPTPIRRTRLIGRFNHGFESFNAVYRSCTPSARRAIGRYLAEGETLSAEVRSRYSQ